MTEKEPRQLRRKGDGREAEFTKEYREAKPKVQLVNLVGDKS